MKKRNLLLVLIVTLIFGVTACQKTPTADNYDSKTQTTQADDTKTEENKDAVEKPAEVVTLKVGATPLPHAEILEVVKPILEKEGVNLEIQEFTDYVLPNTALNDKQLDANFFQHLPYLEKFNTEKGMNLVSVGKVHVEPMGAYSNKIKSIEEISDGAEVAIPNDPTNEGRALLLLQAKGLITLKDDKDLNQTPKDIVENNKNLKFNELEAAALPRTLEDVEFAIINTNYALEAGFNPMADALFIEDGDSAYANLLVAREDNKDDEAIAKLVKALQSEEVRTFIEEHYKGAVVPAF